MRAPRVIKAAALIALVVVALVGYTMLMARIASGTPPETAAPQSRADEILVIKSTRELRLLKDGTPFKRYSISLGAAPSGHKTEEGDERTPEGRYTIDWRNENSVAHLSLHISYPNEADTAQAEARAVSAGGNIMIHGLPNGWGALGRMHLLRDWTNGCIAVTNAEMREIWSLVPDGTPITIVDTL